MLDAYIKNKDPFDYQSLPLYLKVSNWLSWFSVSPNLKKGTWLDIMCGYRNVLQRSQFHNRIITGFYCIDKELDHTLVEEGFYIKKYMIKKRLPYKNNSFDNITYINGLEHMWDPQAIIAECYRILKPKGRLQIIVPTWFAKPILECMAFQLKVQNQITESMNDHKMYYDEKVLWPMLVRAGFFPSNIFLKRIKFYCSLYAVAIKS